MQSDPDDVFLWSKILLPISCYFPQAQCRWSAHSTSIQFQFSISIFLSCKTDGFYLRLSWCPWVCLARKGGLFCSSQRTRKCRAACSQETPAAMGTAGPEAEGEDDVTSPGPVSIDVRWVPSPTLSNTFQYVDLPPSWRPWTLYPKILFLGELQERVVIHSCGSMEKSFLDFSFDFIVFTVGAMCIDYLE